MSKQEFKYGVEYPTNGKRPDLPDDVFIEVKSQRFEWGNRFRLGDIAFSDNLRSSLTFRIVDERYKPKTEPLGNSEQLDNSWREQGEMPPVGSFVDVVGEVQYGSGEENCEVIAHVENCAVIRMSWGLGCFESHVLMPVKTEREKFVVAALELYDDYPQVWLHAMFKAGFRAPEEKNE